MAHKSHARMGGAHAPVKTADATNNFMGLQGCEKLSGRCRTVRTAAIKVKRERRICVRQRWRAMAQTDRAYDVVQTCYDPPAGDRRVNFGHSLLCAKIACSIRGLS